MSSRWLRFFHMPEQGVSFLHKVISLFLAKCMDYTVQANVSVSGDWFSTEKNGTTGSFSGSDWNFTDSSAPFVAGDRGKYLVVRDNSNPENAGIYYIRKFNSATSIEIDFLTVPDEYPKASTGLSWWIIGKDYQMPATNDYCRLRSRHTTQWALQLEIKQNANWLYCGVSVDGQWETTGRILNTTYNQNPLIYGDTGAGDDSLVFLEGDYDGEWLNATYSLIGDAYNPRFGIPYGFIIARLDNVIEAGKTEYEKIVLAGANGSGNFESNFSSDSVGYCRYWNEDQYTWKIGYMIGLSYLTATSTFVKDLTLFNDGVVPVLNKRIGSSTHGKIALMPGTYVLSDPNNTDNMYHMIGRMKGHWRMNRFRNALSDNHRDSRMWTPIDLNGTRDKFIVYDGFVINWNGYTNGY